MKRLAVFSFFDIDGVVDAYIGILLQELKTVSSFLIVVVNGKLNKQGKEFLMQYADRIVIRENVGHDGGAYADVCINHLGEERVLEYDEVVFINDTFFGPFIKLKDVFTAMENKECDFWGLNVFHNGFWSFIESYFLVFRRKIIQGRDLFIFCKNMLNGLAKDSRYSYLAFELGIYHDLINKGYKAGYYTDAQNTSVYFDPDICIAHYNLPILKKKSFSSDMYDEDKELYALRYIMEEFDYDVKLIIECVKRKYGISIQEEQLTNYDMSQCRKRKYGLYVPETTVTDEEVLNFLNTEADIYIYGAGGYAKIIWYLYERYIKKFAGFIISTDRYYRGMEFCGYTVTKYSEVKENAKILLGLNKTNSDEVMKIIGDREGVLNFWKVNLE